MSPNDYDEELYHRIEELDLDKDSAAYGIAMQVVNVGYDSLSPSERHIYDTEVAPLLREQAEEEEMNRRFDPD